MPLKKIYIVRVQKAPLDDAYGPPCTLGDPYTDKEKAEARRDNWLTNYPTTGHAWVETHWMDTDE